MKITIAYEIVYFFWRYIFLKTSYFLNALYIANVTIKQFIKYCFTLWIYNVIKTMRKKRRWRYIYMDKTEEKQSTVTIMTSGDGKGTFFSNVKTKREIFRINILKKRIFKKIEWIQVRQIARLSSEYTVSNNNWF